MVLWMNGKPIDGKLTGETDSPFLKDIGTIVHSAAFRRLSNKTQVHLNPQIDYPRSRLTHSLEVAQVATQLARELCKKLAISPQDMYKKKTGRYFETDFANLAHGASIAHDIGQAPFGHKGEEVLNLKINAITGNKTHFEANKQNVRILLNENFNVSRALVDAITKYKDSVKPNKDWGCYQMERDRVISIFEENETDIFFRHPISYLMEAADDICYVSADLEDAFKMNIVDAVDIE